LVLLGKWSRRPCKRSVGLVEDSLKVSEEIECRPKSKVGATQVNYFPSYLYLKCMSV
jgi:hypothetical protein